MGIYLPFCNALLLFETLNFFTSVEVLKSAIGATTLRKAILGITTLSITIKSTILTFTTLTIKALSVMTLDT